MTLTRVSSVRLQYWLVNRCWKLYIAAGNVVKAAQEQGIFVVLIDSENALDEKWLHALDVDTSEDKLLKLNMSMIDDVAKTVSDSERL